MNCQFCLRQNCFGDVGARAESPLGVIRYRLALLIFVDGGRLRTTYGKCGDDHLSGATLGKDSMNYVVVIQNT